MTLRGGRPWSQRPAVTDAHSASPWDNPVVLVAPSRVLPMCVVVVFLAGVEGVPGASADALLPGGFLQVLRALRQGQRDRRGAGAAGAQPE